MKKPSKKELLASFIEENSHVVFCEEHLEIFGSLLTPRESLKRTSITRSIRFVSQEKAGIKHTSGIEVSRVDKTKVSIKITSMDGIDTLEIETGIPVDKIIKLLKDSKSLVEFAVRKNSTASDTLQAENEIHTQQTWIPILG